MATEVILTKSGMGIEEGTVVRWHKRVGEHVVSGELLVEIETAKTVQEVEAPETGTLSEIRLHEGETGPVHCVLGVIESA